MSNNAKKSKTKKVKFHHKVKKTFNNRHPFFVPLITMGVLFFGSIIVFLIFGGQAVKPADTKIIHFHSQSKSVSVPTRATTVKEFLDRAKITVGEGDLVEPALDSTITSQEFSINLYKAKLVTVIDPDGKRTFLKTAETSPEVVVAKAGYKLFPEDKIEVVSPNDTVKEGVLGTQVKIDSATPVKLVLFGVPYDIRTQANTVAELAKERNFTYTEGSILPASSTPVSPNMAIFVTEPGKQITTGEEIIPRGQDTIYDENLSIGKTEIRDEGSDGKKAIVYEVSANGAKKYLQEIVVINPVNRVVAKGKKVVALAPSVSVSGDKASLMLSAGISPSDYSYVDYIVSKESGWRPGAGNVSSGAYGLCQSLPASKMATAGSDYLTNPVTQLRWCNGYATRAYGSWAGAYAFWVSHRWW